MSNLYKLDLDLLDLKLLTELDKNSRLSSQKISKKLLKSRSSIDYRLNNLVDKGIIINFITSVNPCKMGYKIFKCYICLKNINPRKEQLLDFLKKSNHVYWLTECFGAYDLIITFVAKSDFEFFNIKNNLISLYNDIIISHHIDLVLKVRQYYKSYFLNKVIFSDIYFGGDVVDNKLDVLDHNILEEIIINSRESYFSISKRLKTTPAIVKNRILNLEKKGIIIQYRIGVDLNKINLEFYKAIIELDGLSQKDLTNLTQYISNFSSVVHFVIQLWRLEIEFVTKNYSEFFSFVSELKSKFPNCIKKLDFVLMNNDIWMPGFRNLSK